MPLKNCNMLLGHPVTPRAIQDRIQCCKFVSFVVFLACKKWIL